MPRKLTKVDPATIEKWSHVSVQWEDAFESENRPVNSKEFIEEYEACIRHTIGWFLGYDGARIFVTSTNDSQKQIEDEDCDSILVIPYGMVVGLRTLTRKKRPKKVPAPIEPT